MVHGDCRSIGCYAMTDPVIDEIWQLITAALQGERAAAGLRDGGARGGTR
jgi:murein L,D-transpeptidase YafK